MISEKAYYISNFEASPVLELEEHTEKLNMVRCHWHYVKIHCEKCHPTWHCYTWRIIQYRQTNYALIFNKMLFFYYKNFTPKSLAKSWTNRESHEATSISFSLKSDIILRKDLYDCTSCLIFFFFFFDEIDQQLYHCDVLKSHKDLLDDDVDQNQLI